MVEIRNEDLDIINMIKAKWLKWYQHLKEMIKTELNKNLLHIKKFLKMDFQDAVETRGLTN